MKTGQFIKRLLKAGLGSIIVEVIILFTSDLTTDTIIIIAFITFVYLMLAQQLDDIEERVMAGLQ